MQDVDGVIARVVELGAKVQRPAEDQFYDDRDGQSRDLAEDAEWLVGLLHQLMPAEPEVAGLLALIRLHRARAAARFGADSGLVLLPDQDRSLRDREAIGDAVPLLTRARQQRPGQARAADRRALELTTNPAEQAVLQQRLTWI